MGRAFILALLVLTGCAGHSPITMPPIPAPPTRVMSLIGRFGLAHACPVDNHIVTAAHVATRIPRGSVSQYPASYIYQQGKRKGYVTSAMDPEHAPSQFADLGFLTLVEGDKPSYNVVGQKVEKGEKVHWYEYDYGSAEDMLKLTRRDSEVARVVAGHLVTEESPEHGASGGCIFNEKDEVVGIVVFGLSIENGRFDDWAGVGVVITKDWGW